jgi:ketosteroid isomerase-like protein
MGTAENKAIAIRLVKALSEGDNDALRSMVAEDCKWWVIGLPRDRTLSREQMIRGNKLLGGILPNGFNMSVLEITAEDDRVAVEVEGRAYTSENTLYNNFYHFLFVFRDGKVISGKEYTNPGYAMEVLGPERVKSIFRK